MPEGTERTDTGGSSGTGLSGGAGAGGTQGGRGGTAPDEAGASGAAGDSGLAGAGGTAEGGAGEGGAGGEAGPATGGVAGKGGGAQGGSGGQSGGGGKGGTGGAGGGPSPVDACPSDPNKLQPGKCGCGVPDVATPTVSDCAPLKSKLVTRYDFEGSGTTVTDRVGARHGAVRSAQLSKIDGKGVVLLGGGTNGGYVDLPNDVLGSLKNASFEAWLNWGGGDAQQRIFDFGDTTNNLENTPGAGRSYLFATAKAAAGPAQVGFSLDGVNGEQRVDGTAALPTSLAQVVVVANDDNNRLLLYVNGQKVGDSEWLGSLSTIKVVNAWLGRSQWDRDIELSGVFHEFRIYGAALSAAEVAGSFGGGPDPVYLAY